MARCEAIGDRPRLTSSASYSVPEDYTGNVRAYRSAWSPLPQPIVL